MSMAKFITQTGELVQYKKFLSGAISILAIPFIINHKICIFTKIWNQFNKVLT